MSKSKKPSNKWEIRVTGNSGEFKQKGDVELKSEDVVSCLKSYFMLYERENPKCSNNLYGKITICIRHIKD